MPHTTSLANIMIIGHDKYPVIALQGSVNIACFKRAVERSGAKMMKLGDNFFKRLSVSRASAEGGGAGVCPQQCSAFLC
jgi:hypothetical protein